VGHEHLQGDEDGAEAQVGSHDQLRGRLAESLDAGEDDALNGEHCEPEPERDPDAAFVEAVVE
jgi:hypothetical protein